MPEPEAPRHIGWPNQVQAQQVVERLHRALLRERGGRRDQLGLERVPGDRGALHDAPDVLLEQGELLAERPHHGAWHGDAPELDGGRRRDWIAFSVERADELLEVEGVSTALLVERLGHIVTNVAGEHLPGVGGAQRAELDAHDEALPTGDRERRCEALGHLAGAHREHDHHTRGGSAP